MADNKSQFADSLMRYLEGEYGDMNGQPLCQSPIEGMMMWALSAVGALQSGGENVISIHAQHQIGSYRVDFLVTVTYVRPPHWSAQIIVECDGHDFHEKTKEQASRDKKRERDLQAAGFSVFRFSGSDIWKDVCACALEVFEFLDGEISKQDFKHFRQEGQE